MPRNKKFEGDMTDVGQMRTPPFVKLPDINTLFEGRKSRFERLSATSPVKDYIDFLALFTNAQHATCERFSALELPVTDAEKAASFKMPPLDRLALIASPAFGELADDFFKNLREAGLSGQSLLALDDTSANRSEWASWASNVILGKLPEQKLAQHIYITGVLQIILMLAASRIDAKKLQPIEGNLCPACGGTHSASMVVGWPSSEGTRFCSCLYCGSLWHFVRIKCTFCEETGGIGYREIEGGPGTILAETCQSCGKYCKQMNHQKDSSFDVFADDIGSLALDLMMKQDGFFKRGTFNPFLAGY